MEELNENDWKILSCEAVKKFAKALGKERVRSDERGIFLTFDVDVHNGSLGLFKRFGDLAFDAQIRFDILPSDIGKIEKGMVFEAVTGTSEVLIPSKQRNIAKVLVLADQMTSAKAMAPEKGEQVRPVMPNEPEHAIVGVTGVPWSHVVGSSYGEPMLKAEVSPDDNKIRRRQELGVGLLLRDNPRWDVEEWVQHQEAVEAKTGGEPITAVPATWVSREGISRLEVAGANIKQSLPKVFVKN